MVLRWVPLGFRVWVTSVECVCVCVCIIRRLIIQLMGNPALPLILSCLMLHRAGQFNLEGYAMGECGSNLYPQGRFIMR